MGWSSVNELLARGLDCFGQCSQLPGEHGLAVAVEDLPDDELICSDGEVAGEDQGLSSSSTALARS